MTGVSSTADREIVITRVIPAPREAIFDALVDVDDIAEWWGPRGFTTEVQSMDVRPGGLWRFTMTGADGTVYPNRILFREILRPERLVYEHGSDVDDDPDRFLVTIMLTANSAGATLVEMHSLFPSVHACETVKRFGAVEGGRQTLERLEEYVTTA